MRMKMKNEPQGGYECPSLRVINLSSRGSILTGSDVSTGTIDWYGLVDDGNNWN